MSKHHGTSGGASARSTCAAVSTSVPTTRRTVLALFSVKRGHLLTVGALLGVPAGWLLAQGAVADVHDGKHVVRRGRDDRPGARSARCAVRDRTGDRPGAPGRGSAGARGESRLTAGCASGRRPARGAIPHEPAATGAGRFAAACCRGALGTWPARRAPGVWLRRGHCNGVRHSLPRAGSARGARPGGCAAARGALRRGRAARARQPRRCDPTPCRVHRGACGQPLDDGGDRDHDRQLPRDRDLLGGADAAGGSVHVHRPPLQPRHAVDDLAGARIGRHVSPGGRGRRSLSHAQPGVRRTAHGAGDRGLRGPARARKPRLQRTQGRQGSLAERHRAGCDRRLGVVRHQGRQARGRYRAAADIPRASGLPPCRRVLRLHDGSRRRRNGPRDVRAPLRGAAADEPHRLPPRRQRPCRRCAPI